MRRHNAEMKLALAENLPLAEARHRLFLRRMEAMDRARDERLARIDEENRRRREGERRERDPAHPANRSRYWWEDQ